MSDTPLADAMERRRETFEKIRAQLGGLEYAYIWESKRVARLAVQLLSGCRAHHGIHHFAVFAEGKGVAFSEAGRECLLAADLLPAGGE